MTAKKTMSERFAPSYCKLRYLKTVEFRRPETLVNSFPQTSFSAVLILRGDTDASLITPAPSFAWFGSSQDCYVCHFWFGKH